MSLPAARVLAFLMLIGLAACGTGGSRSAQAPRYPTGAACLAGLQGMLVEFHKIDDFQNGQGCGLETAVEVEQLGADLSPDAQLSCSGAWALSLFEQQVVQPAALLRFGQPVRRMLHWGAYVCRGRSSNRGRLSEHALGRAIDIATFELADGTRIEVERDWRDPGPRGAFLREIARGACSVFSLVLSPNYDHDHRNHLHLDIGPWPLCGV